MKEILVQIDNLGKVFQRDSVSIRALQDINLKIEEGEFICLLGPSGSGGE